MHSYHARTDPSIDPMYFDGCAECLHHAQRPEVYLDTERLAAMWDEMVRVERDYSESYRSVADGVAGRNLYRFAVFMERIGINPWQPLGEMVVRPPF
jgi:hypothetical protein